MWTVKFMFQPCHALRTGATRSVTARRVRRTKGDLERQENCQLQGLTPGQLQGLTPGRLQGLTPGRRKSTWQRRRAWLALLLFSQCLKVFWR